MSAPAVAPAFAHVRDWVFDLDNTLYPAASSIYEAVEARMTAYIARALALDAAMAAELREHYFHQYGATVVGLVREHGLNGADFLAVTHDVEPDMLAADVALNALIAALPGRRIVFTNAGEAYAHRVLERIGLSDQVEHVCHIESAGFCAKPEAAAYAALVRQVEGIDPRRSVLVEDTLRNLGPAHEMGFTTVLVGAVHPAPLPDYVDFYAHDLTAFLRDVAGVQSGIASLAREMR